jgi:lysophospholipase L1-like esterase
LKILFIGDSITDAGRTNDKPPLGEGYVLFFSNMLTAEFPSRHFSILNKGICGNTIEGLSLRWQNDVIRQKPDVLFILIGINDVHTTLSLSIPTEDRISHFKSTYSALIQQTKNELPGCSIILLSPFYVCRTQNNPIKIMTELYSKTVQNISRIFDLPLIDLQSLFQNELIKSNEKKWSEDKVHPTPEGHDFIARHILAYFKKSIY